MRRRKGARSEEGAMGLDFSALIHYGGPRAEVLQAIDRLEGSEADAVGDRR